MEKNPYKIRPAEPSDLNNIVELCTLHSIHEIAEYHSTGKAKKLGQYLFSKSPKIYCLVVEHDANLIGYATYMLQFSTWDARFYIYMDCLFLTEESRGLGIGEMLMDKIKIKA